MIDLNNLKKKAYEYAKIRAENGGTKPLNTFNLLKHCATEVIESTYAYSECRFEDACTKTVNESMNGHKVMSE